MKIKVVMCPADRKPYVTNISDSLENLQKIVGGYIEVVHFACDGVFIVNEEGWVQHLPVNRSMKDLYGDVIIAGYDGSEIVGLTDGKAKWLLAMMKRQYDEGACENGTAEDSGHEEGESHPGGL